MKNGDQPINPVRSQSLEGGHTDYGLTKREYFAAMAMQGMIAGLGAHLTLSEDEANVIASQSIQFADELLKQLEK